MHILDSVAQVHTICPGRFIPLDVYPPLSVSLPPFKLCST